MKYFGISTTTSNLNVIGAYPQTEFGGGVNVEQPDSAWKVDPFKIPNFIPKWSLKLNSEAYETDFLDPANLYFGFVINEKVIEILKCFNLPTHRYYPIDVQGATKKYFWFHYISEIWEYIDLSKSEIEIYDKINFKAIQNIRLTCSEDINLYEKELPRRQALRFCSIYLKNNFPNYDIFKLRGPEYFTLISERLKKRLAEEGITGFETREYNKITIQPS